MTIQERKNRIITKIETLSEEQMTTFENFILEITKEATDEKEREEKVKSIIKRDFFRFKETFKALS